MNNTLLAIAISLLTTSCGADVLVGRAVLPAVTFAPGPTSATLIGTGPINGQDPPFVDAQPVQGFSALVENDDGTFLALSDNGFGEMANSSDYRLRIYRIRVDFRTAQGGTGEIEVLEHLEISDPDRQVPFPIVHEFSADRVLTGADLDPESLQRAPDGTLWIGDELGPFLLHTSADGRLLEPPIPLPDGLHAPESPMCEEGMGLRLANALAGRAASRGAPRPVFSPWDLLLDDGDETTFVPHRQAPPEGLAAASSEIFDPGSFRQAGFPLLVWSVNDPERMKALIDLGVGGIITDRPDLLRQVIAEHAPELLVQGLVDPARFDAQGHRGARDLRPENTLPAMEAALDQLVTTLETDVGVTADGVAILSHDPVLRPDRCRRTDGQPWPEQGAELILMWDSSAIQSTFVCDVIDPDRPEQSADPALSPVSGAFAAQEGLADRHVPPTLEQLLDFAQYYAWYYREGPGTSHPESALRAHNASRVRFNVEAKVVPREPYSSWTADAGTFVEAIGERVAAREWSDRVDVQSFDLSVLLVVQDLYPAIRTALLLGDDPEIPAAPFPASGLGTNLQSFDGSNPYLAGLSWPYRVTGLDHPARVRSSGGFEGMALSTDGRYLLPVLEKPLVDGEGVTVFEFELASRSFTGRTVVIPLDPRATGVGEFQMVDATHGILIERDDSEGDMTGHKVVNSVDLGPPVTKSLLVDLLAIEDPDGIAPDAVPFGFPFFTIESLLVIEDGVILIANDNNFPFSVGRHVDTGAPDDTEIILVATE